MQQLFEFTLPGDCVAIKSFAVKIEKYRGIITLNITKPTYQVSYVISKEQEKLQGSEEIYFEAYREDMGNDSMPVGFQDIISSV